MVTQIKSIILLLLLTLLQAPIILSCKKTEQLKPKPAIPNLTLSNASITEGSSGSKQVSIGIHLSEPTTVNVKVEWSTLEGTAKAGEDYVTILNGSVTFLPGETLKTIELSIVSDDILEFNEEFYFQIDSVYNGISIIRKGTITIENDDTYTPEKVSDGYITPNTYPGMTLTWSDEFNGSSLDPASWTHEEGGGGWGNTELQTYTSSNNNSFVSNGYLTIRAIKDPITGVYTSARLNTKWKREFTYGRIDIRAKMPIGKGIWPALWMLGTNISTFGWPNCGEIDIMEYLGHDVVTTYGTVHYNDNGHKYKGSNYQVTSAENFHDKFHVFTLIWQENIMEWYVDYHKYFTATSGSIKFEAFNLPQFFIFNVAVGGTWPGNPDASTTFPQDMVVDYVRVFN
ncbi:MAG: family 16 glycosylhydrolase [Bacteroidales bacterium]|nr:family 16 glycosylhydrolase [Bacteroidales bacterium]